jgi:Rap1a immunity proteins
MLSNRWQRETPKARDCSKMKLVALFLSFALLAPALSQEKHPAPVNGNELLDFCKEIVRAMDVPHYTVDDGKFQWCAGYLRGYVDSLLALQVLMTPSFAERTTKGPAGICIPDNVSLGQTARIVVKWLESNPKDLHQDAGTLTFVILRDAFRCQPGARN